MDRIDRKIIVELQRDATLSLARLADRVGLSQTPCWKRVQKLEQTGVITRRVALVDPQMVSLGLTAFVAISANDHSPSWREAFARGIAGMAEITEVWRMAGEADYLLKVVTRDMASFDAFYRRLTETLELKSVTSSFAMERVAYTTALPIAIDEP
ncbi:Lrp/AsnC family transcriptional regulator [Rubellimicrobium arenae]|uniref:Lrp/AsnC family transcriptional regulator n=1 Tax=Rubellimicrobium arenae TaxID=2817372 RepID=UPI001B3013EB|nr:Lrp/AsnC family transcriptional regulator [Rubellimicrobium arenae]